MASPRSSISLRLDAVLWERVQARARDLGQSYTVFVARALEQALAGGEAGGPSAAVRPRGGRSVGLASARASVPEAWAGAGRSPAEATSGGKSPEREIDAPPAAELPRIARRHWAS